MIKITKPIASVILKPLVSLSLGLSLIGCSPAETDHSHHHDEESHDASHAASHAEENTPQKNVTETHDDEGHETHSEVMSAESHTHGDAMLAIVSENNRISIEFETPLFNLLGFEYAPVSDAEKVRVAFVEQTLADPQNLIRFNADAKCTYLPFNSKVELFDDHGEDEHDDHDEDHDEDHDDDHEENSDNHTDVILNYELTCKAIDKLKEVHVEFFDVFSNFTELELVYLGPTQQMSAKLSPSRPHADLN